MNEFVGADPLDLLRELWPERRMYGKQKKMVHSVRDALESYVVACNGSGKDFCAGFIVPTFFKFPWVYFTPEYVQEVHRVTPDSWPMKMRHTRRIITTSVSDQHMIVLWAEVGMWLETCKYPMLLRDGGDIVLNDQMLRFHDEMHLKNPPNYAMGMVAERPEKFSGHHARYTLAVGDEASGLPNVFKERVEGWAKRRLYFGNAEQCVEFFRPNYEKGTELAEPGMGVKYTRQCFRMTADDSPNVLLAKQQLKAGQVPTGELLLPGVVSWPDYRGHRKNLDPIRQAVVLDAKWYDGPQLKLIPQSWIDEANKYGMKPWDGREGRRPPPSPPFYMGVDCAEGGDDTSWVLIDRYGILEIVSLKTQDTNIIYGETLRRILEQRLQPEHVCFDRGGGGKQCADRLRAAGHNVRTVDFGVIKAEPKRGIRLFPEKKEVVEEKGLVKDRRSEMYWDLRMLLEIPASPSELADEPLVVNTLERLGRIGVKAPLPPTARFALPMYSVDTPRGPEPMCQELIRQLKCVPLTYDELGRFKLIPKQKPKKLPTDPEDPMTFRALIGRSPDIADALALAWYGVEHKPVRMQAGVH